MRQRRMPNVTRPQSSASGTLAQSLANKIAEGLRQEQPGVRFKASALEPYSEYTYDRQTGGFDDISVVMSRRPWHFSSPVLWVTDRPGQPNQIEVQAKPQVYDLVQDLATRAARELAPSVEVQMTRA